MDSPTSIHGAGNLPEILTPNGSCRCSSSSNSPEFEFCRLTNPSSLPDPDLLSADELFLDGVLLPLQLLSVKSSNLPSLDAHQPDPDPPPTELSAPLVIASEPEATAEPVPGVGPKLTIETTVSVFTASKRWRDIFRKSGSRQPEKSREDKEKESQKRDKKSQNVSGSGSGAELNINIWPFSRSRSARNSLTRPRMSFGAPVTRKVSSAPCSRSNSAGESKSRKWPNSPGRVGVHLGRSSPVWHIRRGGLARKQVSEPPACRTVGRRGAGGKDEIAEAKRGKMVNAENKLKAFNLNVPMCIGCRSQLSCNNRRGDSRKSNNGNGLFGFRNLFVKKVH